MSEARNHHYVPQGYLRRFADGIGRKARVHVCDRVTATSFKTLVRNVAALRDFNRIDTEGQDPNALESAYAEFECAAAEALVRVEKTGSFSEPGDREPVIGLVALLAARNPRNREQFGQFQKHVLRRMMDMMVSSKDRWDELGRRAGAVDAAEGEVADVSYEEMRNFVKEGGIDIELDQTHQIGLELELLDPMIEMLSGRKWTLRVAAANAGHFVTSDHPVVLMPVGWDPGPYGIGFGTANTVVIFPLNRRMLLTGTFEGEDRVIEVGAPDVAKHNRHVIMAAERQVYAFDNRFAYLSRPFGYKTGADLPSDAEFLGRSTRGLNFG